MNEMDFKCFRKHTTQKLLISPPHLHNAAVPLETNNFSFQRLERFSHVVCRWL